MRAATSSPPLARVAQTLADSGEMEQMGMREEHLAMDMAMLDAATGWADGEDADDESPGRWVARSPGSEDEDSMRGRMWGD